LSQNKKNKFFLRCLYITVKEGRRRRYIGFKISSKTTNKYFEKDEIIDEIKIQCRTLFNKECNQLGIYLIRLNEDQGIVRCKHIEKDNTIKLLRSIENISDEKVEVQTLGTSGTIKSLIKKHMNT